MVRRQLIIAALAVPVVLCAQEDIPYTGAGLLRASGGISPGFLLNAGTTNIYLAGKAEYFIENKLSFRGEGFWYVNSQQDPAPLEQNGQLAFGPFLHSIHGRLDLSIGVEAGLSLVHPARTWPVLMIVPNIVGPDPAPLRAVPTAAICGGLSYAVWDYLHFFVDVRMLRSRYEGSPVGTLNLDEVIVGGGLGWQLRVRK
ncbi:MAG: hypothetical protein IT225_02615 [Flavobacteriales bacterium]|nr:hypothetical protein [Flavobacteriales bacterium]